MKIMSSYSAIDRIEDLEHLLRPIIKSFDSYADSVYRALERATGETKQELKIAYRRVENISREFDTLSRNLSEAKSNLTELK